MIQSVSELGEGKLETMRSKLLLSFTFSFSYDEGYDSTMVWLNGFPVDYSIIN